MPIIPAEFVFAENIINVTEHADFAEIAKRLVEMLNSQILYYTLIFHQFLSL